jgi:sugar/nucleoside kinase (ribokinase family)
MKVVGVGLISLDLVVNVADGSAVRAWAGGTCGNVLTILGYLGWEAYPVARLNGAPDAQRVRADMARWGVRLDFIGCEPTRDTPIIIEQIRRRRDGTPNHFFQWSCPRCGRRLPRFAAVTLGAVAAVAPALRGASAIFLDRVSPAALALAQRAAAEGAVVVFEPQSPGNDSRMFAAAMRIAHVVKYADQRLPEVAADDAATLLEVQTLGARGLRYRHRLGRGVSDWIFFDAVPAARVVDTCGSGDWCTAGLIAKAAASGLAGFRNAGADGVDAALRYGQGLAAWNCGFEGARGGMYVDEEQHDVQIACPGCDCGAAATQGKLTAT